MTIKFCLEGRTDVFLIHILKNIKAIDVSKIEIYRENSYRPSQEVNGLLGLSRVPYNCAVENQRFRNELSLVQLLKEGIISLEYFRRIFRFDYEDISAYNHQWTLEEFAEAFPEGQLLDEEIHYDYYSRYDGESKLFRLKIRENLYLTIFESRSSYGSMDLKYFFEKVNPQPTFLIYSDDELDLLK